MGPRFDLFLSDSNQRCGMGSRFSWGAAGIERLSLDLPRAVKIIEGCGNVWNL